jgi:hypothetical protein
MSHRQKLNKIRFKLADSYLKRRNLAGAIEVAWEILEDQPNNRKGIRILRTAREEERRLSAAA